MTNNRTLTHADLRQFTGDLKRYRHWATRSVIYTPGVQFLAESGGAYWLIDEIVLALGSKHLQRRFEADPRAAEMLFWTLRVSPDASATLAVVVDQDEPPVFQNQISFTDFPLDQVDIWSASDGVVWTLYLPSEH